MGSLIVNSAHADSLYTCLAFSQDGSKLYTGGEEGYVRIWRPDLGSVQEPDVAVEGDDAITSVATSKYHWLSGSLDACVRRYDAQGSAMEGLVTRAVAVPVRCVAIDPKGERVAVTSDELEVKIVDLKDTTNITKLEGHRKGVRRATWHPSGTLLTTCGSDGDIIIWDVSLGGEPKRIETITGVIPAVESESLDYVHDCSAAWHPSGKYFVVASRAHELVTISREHWKRDFTFSDDSVTGAVTALALSPNGTYLASATSSGIFIWSTATRRVLFQHVPSTPLAVVTHLAFSPTQNLLAWTDTDGTLTRWPDPIPATAPDPIKSQLTSSSVGIPLKKTSDPLSFDDDNDASTKKGHDGLEDEVGHNYGVDDDDWMIDDIGLLDKTEKEKERGDGDYTREMVSVTKAQAAFQPASTPMANKKRYLAFNMIGVIEVTDQDTHHIINVDFHDRSTRAGSHFQDSNKCDVASLGERGALYACPPEAGHPAQIMYKPYSGWASSGEWSCTLPEGEAVIALAAGGSSPSGSLRNKSEGDIEGNGNVVVATTRGYLRFLTGGGVQRYVWALGADVVTMVAGCEWVFVVHRDGGTSLDGCQNLAYTLVSFDTLIIVQNGRLPLPKGSILKWIGISEEGAPAMYDSNGLLSILDHFRRPGQGRWIPMLDTTTLTRRQGKDESYWPVGVSSTFFMCLILKGRESYPGFPRPLIQELDVQLPLFNLDIPQGQMEERFLREELHIGFLRDALGADLTNQEISQREVNLDKQLIQLIQLACKGDKLQRALDAAALLHHTQSFDMAIKVAEFYHLVGLQDKLMRLKGERAEIDRLEEERDHRMKWGKRSVPIAAPQKQAPESSRWSHFEDFAPPPMPLRKSLATAMPVTAKSHIPRDDGTWNSRNIAESIVAARALASDSSPWDNSSEADIPSSLGEGKRKRDEHPETSQADDSFDGSANKKRATGPMETPESSIKSSKPSANPFARKFQEPRGNPFSRPGVTETNIAKSNSFFDKVDEANDNATQSNAPSAKVKAKEKKDASRQTTLFGLPPGSGPEKRIRGRPKGGRNVTGEAGAPKTPLEGHSADVIMDDTVPSNSSKTQRLNPDDQGAIEASANPPEIEWPPSPPRGSKPPEVTVN
ncbi:hypothetical protein K439DRAFT_1651834 [Ramaria rubella]|nr:hypothetical protein K439DRAFT_1651834 [Ramaria rubella]